MKTVAYIMAVRRIGQIKDGYTVEENQVRYSDGSTGTLYRLNRGDGKIYGLQSTKPAVRPWQDLLIGEAA